MFDKIFSISYILKRDKLFAELKSKVYNASRSIQSDSIELTCFLDKTQTQIENTKKQITKRIKQFKEFNINDSIQQRLWSDIIDRINQNTDRCLSMMDRIDKQSLLLRFLRQQILLEESPLEKTGSFFAPSPNEYTSINARSPINARQPMVEDAGPPMFEDARLSVIKSFMKLLLYPFYGLSLRIEKLIKGKVNDQMVKFIFKIILFIIGIALFVGSIISKPVTTFLTSLIGISNTGDLPQTVVTIVLLILSLTFLFWSLYNSEAIRSVLISRKLDDELREFEEGIDNDIAFLKEDYKNQKAKVIALCDDVFEKLHKLEEMNTNKIHGLQIEAIKKTQEFIAGNEQEIYKYKLTLIEKLVHLEEKLATLEEECAHNDSLINHLIHYNSKLSNNQNLNNVKST